MRSLVDVSLVGRTSAGRYEMHDLLRQLELYHQALALHRELDDTYFTALTLEHLAHSHNALGEREHAIAAWQEALRLYLSQTAPRTRHAPNTSSTNSAHDQPGWSATIARSVISASFSSMPTGSGAISSRNVRADSNDTIHQAPVAGSRSARTSPARCP